MYIVCTIPSHILVACVVYHGLGKTEKVEAAAHWAAAAVLEHLKNYDKYNYLKVKIF